jgi:asparagine synthase (glutamine-hydrolysing)
VAAAAGRIAVDSLEHATDLVEAEIDRCVADPLVADVPVGAFLSGGVDSSLVVASMVRKAGQGVRTFALGHDDPAYDESSAAARVAAALGTRHERLVPTESEVLAAALSMPDVYDEPFADSSQIATYLIARLARADVKVALSGDGGDELFFGYNRYRGGPRVWSVARRVPAPLRRGIAVEAGAVGQRGFDRLHRALGFVAPDVRLPGRQAVKLLHAFASGSPGDLYGFLRSVSPASRRLVFGRSVDRIAGGFTGASDLASEMRLHDLESYLPDDVMTKVDRATMAVSLEAREPLLDHRLVEMALAIPREMHMHGGATKAVLRRVLARRLPASLFERPKMGVAVPIAAWLRGPLRAWAADMLASRALFDDGAVDTVAVRALWAAHVRGASDHADALWPVVMYAAWRRRSE